MKISQQVRKKLQFQNSAFVVLLLLLTGMLAYLSQQFSITIDWSSSQRHSLSATSEKLLSVIGQPIKFTVFIAADSSTKRAITELLHRYKRHDTSIEVNYIDPVLSPDLARKFDIQKEAEIVIEVAGKTEKITQLSEDSITNAIYRLSKPEDRWLLFVEGHGERDINGIANHDYGDWGKHLLNKGFKVRPINLAENPVIPLGISALVIASPQLQYLPGEVETIKQFIQQGGNLLWLTEPGTAVHLEKLAALLNIKPLAGTIIDPNTRRLINADERIAIVTHYLQHAATSNFNNATLFPRAGGLAQVQNSNSDWTATPVLQTLPGSWLETGELKTRVEFNEQTDIAGPINIAFTLERKITVPAETDNENTLKTKTQRIMVIADGDFISNAYLGNGGNLDLGTKLINWLGHDDRYIEIPARTIADLNVVLSQTAQAVLAFGFLLALPALLGGSGVFIWLRRRRQ